MSCPNFEFMEYDLPLIVGCPALEEMGYDDAKEIYEKENGEEYDEDMYYADIEVDYDCLYDDMCHLAGKLNEDLRFFTVEVKSGHYRGLQFIVNSEYDFDKTSQYCIDNYESQYEYGECRSRVLRKAKSELNKIRKWLLGLKDQGFIELNCDGVFSNGEAIYSIAS